VTVWLLIVGVGVVSLALRASSLVLLRDRRLPEGLTALLGLVPAAVLAALIVPDLLFTPGTQTFAPLGPRLLAGVVAAAVAWRTRNVLWTLVTGLGLLVILNALGWH